MNSVIEKKSSSVFDLKDVKLGEIHIKDTLLLNAENLEIKYLLSLDPDRLLAGFLEAAGLEAKKNRYQGWEITEIQGHTLGHYITALSQLYASSKDKGMLERIQYIVSELTRCQASDGYLFAWNREIFDRVENRKPAWVPWYTMHKILSGLIAVYQHTGLKEAYMLMRHLGSWIFERCIKWSPKVQSIVLSVEYGGMNDCLYELYMLTEDDRFLKAAHQFDELKLFEPLYKGLDILNGLHANTTIPKIIGALKRYIALGDSEHFYLQVAEKFWDMVIEHHTYITGGNSEWEHFGEPFILDKERTACNCETCNTYNMLKLTKLLFQITKEKKYADYYEQAVLNTILSSQNTNNGMTTYFQPMETGFFKVFSTPYNSFWCCTGSGMESFTKLTDGTCYYGTDTIYINRYYDFDMNWYEKRVRIHMKADMLNSEKAEICIDCEVDSVFTIALRLPHWIVDDEFIFLNNEKIQYSKSEGYIYVSNKWKNGDKITILLPMKLQVHSLPDNPNVVAFTFGPFVLSAGLGYQKLDTTYTGVDVLVPTKELMIRDYLIIENLEMEVWKNDISKYLIKTNGKIEFVIENYEDGKSLIFTPHFMKNEERYGIYFKVYNNNSKELFVHRESISKKQHLEKLLVDIIPIGNDQYELSHLIKGVKTDTMIVHGHKCRYAVEDGWFSYCLKMEEDIQVLCVTYCSEDEGNKFEIYINDILFVCEEISRDEKNLFYIKEYKLPEELTSRNSTINVKFQNSIPQYTCRIYDEMYIRKQ